MESKQVKEGWKARGLTKNKRLKGKGEAGKIKGLTISLTHFK